MVTKGSVDQFRPQRQCQEGQISQRYLIPQRRFPQGMSLIHWAVLPQLYQ